MADGLRATVRAAVITAFLAGTLLIFLRPPSLSGARGLALILAGAAVLVLATGWATIRLAGRRNMSEEDFEHLVRRSEELAASPGLAEEATDFERLVTEAIDDLPPDFRELLESTAVVVSSRGTDVRAYGHYFGDTVARENYEDRIVLYQDTLERDFGHHPDLLRAQVERTLRHELAHHLGWGERGVSELGL